MPAILTRSNRPPRCSNASSRSRTKPPRSRSARASRRRSKACARAIAVRTRKRIFRVCRCSSSATSARAKPRWCARRCAPSVTRAACAVPRTRSSNPTRLLRKRAARALSLRSLPLHRSGRMGRRRLSRILRCGAICLVEWPQRAGGLLGVPDLEFTLEQEGEGRVLIARAYSDTGKSCLERC